jgi:hypothetical protein
MPQTRRGVATWSLVALSLVALLSALPNCFAQQEQAAPGKQDDTSAPQPDIVPPQAPEGALQTAAAILAGRSFFFPQLAVDRNPLTPKQKLELFADESIAPSRILSSAAGAGIAQAWDALPGYGQGAVGYGKRFGSSLATGASSGLFDTFLLPSLLKQDPRYFVMLHGSFGRRVKYALTRTVITRTDHGGRAFNWSVVGGRLAAEILANSYLPPGERTAGKTFERFGVQIGVDAASNVVKEYWPSIFKKLRLP